MTGRGSSRAWSTCPQGFVVGHWDMPEYSDGPDSNVYPSRFHGAAPPHDVVRLEDGDAKAVLGAQRARAQTADAGADDDDVRLVALVRTTRGGAGGGGGSAERLSRTTEVGAAP